MTPQRFVEANVVMRRPAGMTEEQCCDVHACRTLDAANNNVVITCWKPTPEELVKLNLGEPIYLTITGSTMPPVGLQVGSPWEQQQEAE